MTVKCVIMQVSGKITHSFYCFLRERGFDLSRLFELTSLEMEFLKDPSQWMELDQVESFLKKLVHEYSSHFIDKDFLISVGHSCFELNAWGELDSVLKMRKTEPVFSHLPLFLAYFISDEFSLVSERSESGLFGFKCNLSSDDYPAVTEYLRAVLEALPLYTGRPRTEVKWIRDYIQVKWEDEESQTSLFSTPSEMNIKPELLSDLRVFLEKVEKELYYQRQQIGEKDKEVRNLKDQLLMQGIPMPEDTSALLQQMEQHLLELKGMLFSKEREEKEKVDAPLVLSNLYPKIDSLFHILTQLKEMINTKSGR